MGLSLVNFSTSRSLFSMNERPLSRENAKKSLKEAENGRQLGIFPCVTFESCEKLLVEMDSLKEIAFIIASEK